MRLFAISDTHFEFYPYAAQWQALVDSFPDADVIALAGDIAVMPRLEKVVRYICEKYTHVLYVTGNHEYYGYLKSEMDRQLCQLEQEIPGFHFLNRKVVEFGPHRFLGCTLWFPDQPRNVLHEIYMNDFKLIPEFKSWVYQEHALDREFLECEMQYGDIVITHHLPTHAAVEGRFKGEPLNCFFVSDIENIFRCTAPRLMIHGHSHSFFDQRLFETRILRNPMDYYRRGHKPTFKPLVLDLNECE